jgi:2'-5' RNA ligase
MPRHFVAIPLPDEARECLIAVQPPAIPGMRLVGRDELHLTLHFLRELTGQELDAVREALATVRIDAFTISINGIGKFLREGRPQVLWAGVEVNDDLTALHRSIGTVLADAIGFAPEERPYSPHVTLARLNAPIPPDSIERYLENCKGFQMACVLLEQFVLYSRVGPNDLPKYREEAGFALSK